MRKGIHVLQRALCLEVGNGLEMTSLDVGCGCCNMQVGCDEGLT